MFNSDRVNSWIAVIAKLGILVNELLADADIGASYQWWLDSRKGIRESK